MSTAIVDRVAVHGENGSVLITRDRNGWYYVETRKRTGDKTVVQLHRDAMKADDGLLDQLQRLCGMTVAAPAPVPEPEPEPAPVEPPTFIELLLGGMTAKGMSQIDFAAALGLRSMSTVHYWLSGTYLPRRASVTRIAQVLDLDRDELIDAYGRAAAALARKAA